MDASSRIAESGPRARAAAEALRRVVRGRISTTALTRWLYSTDASSYRVVPDVVLVAAATDDLLAAAAIAAEYELPLVVRGAGTSVAGQAIGPGIMVDCFKLDRIVAFDPEAGTARVEPGVVQATLNRAAAPFGLELGPDTSTAEQATIGGMVANNSSGSRSLIYGETKDKVLRLAAVLAGGDGFVFGPTHDGSLASGIAAAGGGGEARRQELAAALTAVRGRHAPAIAGGYPDVRRCTSGYNLRELLQSRPNLARLLAGSEGTLALFTEIELALDRRPARRLGAALAFTDLRAALTANSAILSTGPSAVELLDLETLRRAPRLSAFASLAPLVAGPGQAVLIVEYQGEEEEAREGLARLRAQLAGLGVGQAVWLDTPATLADALALRRALLPLLMGAPGAERPTAFVEDTAVAPERLAAFVADFQALLGAHGLRASFSGHASAGCLHIRPLLDLKTAAGVGHLETLAREVADLVRASQGVISGEHGCGRARSWLLPDLLGPELYGAMVAVKDAFDPGRLLGRGTLVGPQPIAEALRFGATYRALGSWQPRLSHEAEGGFDLAVERCFGAGLCKKLDGTMCPPATVTREEPRSTRARANALQGVLSGALPLEQIGEEEFRDVRGTCHAGKACKTECPAGVDMAALKAEWLAALRARDGVPPLARAAGDLRRLAALAAPVAPLVNAASQTALARRVANRLGVAPERPLPRLVRRPLTRRLPPARLAAGGVAGRAVLYADCFVQYQEPQIGECLAHLLAAAGVGLTVLDAGCCGRTALSTGQIGAARRAAERALECLYAQAAAGADILVIEPSCLAMMRDDWQRLLPEDGRVAAVAAAARPALELVADLAAAGRLQFRPGGHVLLHSHCHEKALGFAAATERALGAVPGLRRDLIPSGCCGMSGIFGYEAAHYEVSVAVAERSLLPAVRSAPPDAVILATGTSCRTQIADLGGRRALHPLELLAARLVGAAAEAPPPAASEVS